MLITLKLQCLGYVRLNEAYSYNFNLFGFVVLNVTATKLKSLYGVHVCFCRTAMVWKVQSQMFGLL